jgi:hypothetical protein
LTWRRCRAGSRDGVRWQTCGPGHYWICAGDLLGADVALVPWLDVALNADRIIAAGLDGEVGGPHPLAGWVHTRDTAHVLAWALNGAVPPALAGRLPRPRRGPVAAAPQLAATDRAESRLGA